MSVNQAFFKVSESLPIIYDNRRIILLSSEYLDKYCRMLMSKSYNEFLENKFNENFTLSRLKHVITDRINSYTADVNKYGEYRLLLLDNNNDIVGCCTLYFDTKSSIELEIAYFIKPKYQGKGEAYSMINKILSTLPIKEFGVTAIRANVFKNNIKSQKLLHRLGFNKVIDKSEIKIEFRREI